MNSLRHFPLGTRFPDSPHAVVASLPTMADVRGYEEKEPRVMNAMKSGYPRFVVHEYVERLVDYYIDREALAGRCAVLVSGRRAADDALHQLGEGYLKTEVDETIYLVHCDASDEPRSHRLKKFIQHTGCGIYSRQAEDLLFRNNLLDCRHDEPVATGNTLVEVESELGGRIGCRSSDVLVCASGMNAFYAGFCAVQEFQASRKRTAWLQLGWLYLDSGKILEELIGEHETLECLYDVSNIDAVIAKIKELGSSLSAVVVECPSNPLVRFCDLKRIADAVREQGGVMMVDPTIASVYNVDVLPFADVLVTSLTKYASIEGDIMAGALAVNPDSPYYGDLILRTSSFYVPLYARDMGRLAHEMKDAPEVVNQINQNSAQLCAFLKKHPAVARVFCTESDTSDGLLRAAATIGAVITIELAGDMEPFYDDIEVMKGPSFGTRYTLLCPFMYLAHYDLVTTDEGRAFLKDVGICPELIRISVGAEPYEEIENKFKVSLDQLIAD